MLYYNIVQYVVYAICYIDWDRQESHSYTGRVRVLLGQRTKHNPPTKEHTPRETNI